MGNPTDIHDMTVDVEAASPSLLMTPKQRNCGCGVWLIWRPFGGRQHRTRSARLRTREHETARVGHAFRGLTHCHVKFLFKACLFL